MQVRRIAGNKRSRVPSSPRYETHPLAGSHTFAFYDITTSFVPFSWHYHIELELIYWPTAKGIRLAGDSIENFENGDCCLIGSNLPHTWSIQVQPRQLERNIQIQFAPDCLGREFMGLIEMRSLSRLIERARQGLKITGPTRQRLAKTLLCITEEKPAKRFCRILELLLDLAQSRDLQPLATTATVASINPRIDGAIGKLLDFIQAPNNEDVTQAKAAALLRMSPAAFSRFFRRHFGKTYIGFVNEIRISRACTSLLQTDQTVAEIAYNVGFENLSNFNEQFRKYKHQSPSEYRRLVQNQFNV